MNSQASSGYLAGPYSGSSGTTRRHTKVRRSRRYGPRSRRRQVVLTRTEQSHAAHSVIGAALQTLGYVALTGATVWLTFSFVP